MALRNRLNQIFAVESCISSANLFSDRYDSYLLKTSRSALYDETIEGSFTLKELKLALDPFEDYSFVKHLSDELGEYNEMYYGPCLSALFGQNIGSNTQTESKYFMAYPWHHYEECTKLTCLKDNVRWDRAEGGCIPSLITGSTAPGYDDGDSMCSYELDKDGGTRECKYNTTALSEFHTSVTNCWSSLPERSIDYIVDHFCTPHLTGGKVDSTREEEIKNITKSCTSPE